MSPMEYPQPPSRMAAATSMPPGARLYALGYRSGFQTGMNAVVDCVSATEEIDSSVDLDIRLALTDRGWEATPRSGKPTAIKQDAVEADDQGPCESAKDTPLRLIAEWPSARIADLRNGVR